MCYNPDNMLQDVPSSSLPWLIGSIVFLIFGLRAVKNYKKLHNPLSQFFAISGFSAALAFGFWSIPLIFTSDTSILMLVNIIGDFFLYIFFIYQAIILHYLVLKSKISLILYLIPVIVIALIGWLSHCYGYIVGGVRLSDGSLEYQLPLFANIIQSIFLVIVFLVGVFLLLRIRQQTETRARLALLGIGTLYILSAIGGSLNVILSGGSNQSPVIISAYIIGFVIFMLVLATIRLHNSKK